MKYNEIDKQVKNYVINKYSDKFIMSKLANDYIYYYRDGFYRIKIIEIYLLGIPNKLEIDIIYNKQIEEYLILNNFKYKIIEDNKYKGINILFEFDYILKLNFLFDLIDYVSLIGKEMKTNIILI